MAYAQAKESWKSDRQTVSCHCVPPRTAFSWQPLVTSPGYRDLWVSHSLWGRSLWVEPSLVGVRAGLLAHCTSLCIPSLFPMQIKLMRIRNIMEPIHRSSRWKMGLTTNFPLQLFCNYRGILWILMEMLSCLTASWLLFFFWKVKKKRERRSSPPLTWELFRHRVQVWLWWGKAVFLQKGQRLVSWFGQSCPFSCKKAKVSLAPYLGAASGAVRR